MLNHHIAAAADDDNDINLDGGGKESTWQGTLSVEPRFAPRDCFLVMRQRGASENIMVMMMMMMMMTTTKTMMMTMMTMMMMAMAMVSFSSLSASQNIDFGLDGFNHHDNLADSLFSTKPVVTCTTFFFQDADDDHRTHTKS